MFYYVNQWSIGYNMQLRMVFLLLRAILSQNSKLCIFFANAGAFGKYYVWIDLMMGLGGLEAEEGGP